MSENDIEDKTLELDQSTIEKLKQVRRKLNEEQYGTNIEEALIYCIEHTHINLIA